MKKVGILLLLLSPLCSLGIMSQCYGAPTVDVNGRATGITELDIDGLLYDVQFRVGPATSIWPDITTATFWDSPTGADVAVESMVNALNSLTPIPSQLADLGGAVAGLAGYVTVPHSLSTAVQGVFFNTWLNIGPSTVGSTIDLFPWAKFSSSGPQKEITIPAPSALALTVTGLVSLLGVRRWRRTYWRPQARSIQSHGKRRHPLDAHLQHRPARLYALSLSRHLPVL